MGILIRETRLRQAQTDTRKPHDKLKYKCHAELVEAQHTGLRQAQTDISLHN